MSVVAEAFRPIATMFPCKGYPLSDGRLAQRLERSPHTREVKGSNPLSPTISFSHLYVAFRQKAADCLCSKAHFPREMHPASPGRCVHVPAGIRPLPALP